MWFQQARPIGIAESVGLFHVIFMPRWFWCLAIFPFCPLIAVASTPRLVIENRLIASPVEAESDLPQLARSPDGAVYLLWHQTGHSSQLKISAWNEVERRWGRPAPVSDNTPLLSAELPQLTAGTGGRVTVLWIQKSETDGKTPAARYASSSDGGITWTKAKAVTNKSETQTHPAVTTLPDGNVLALWIVARSSAAGPNPGIYSRILNSDTPDVLVGSFEAEPESTGLRAFPDGTALAMVRGQSGHESIRLFSTRFLQPAWTPLSPVTGSDFDRSNLPENSLALDVSGARLAVAWNGKTAGRWGAYVMRSPTAGNPFLAPQLISDSQPEGGVDVAQLSDGTVFAIWIDRDEAIADKRYLEIRRIRPDGSLSTAARVATLSIEAARAQPRLTLLRDDPANPRLLVAFTQIDPGVDHVTTRVIDVLPSDPYTVACATCPPLQTRGYPLHGYVQSVDVDRGLARVRFDAIPGVKPAGSENFHIGSEDNSALEPAAEIFARIELREGGWWLFAVRNKN